MGNNTKISWTDLTWSPIRARVKQDASIIAAQKGYTSLVPIATKMAGRAGPHCEVVSAGCAHCYSQSNNHRCLPQNGTGLPFDRRSRDLVEIFMDDRILADAQHFRPGTRVFVENQSDLFGEWIPFEVIDELVGVMAVMQGVTFQVLTKHPERAEEYAHWCTANRLQNISDAITRVRFRIPPFMPQSGILPWPSPNVWIGTSAENQETYNSRIGSLLAIPAPVHFISYEPALGMIDFALPALRNDTRMVDWIICGAESGPGARDFDEDWARSARDQCLEAQIPFFYKQKLNSRGKKIETPELDGLTWTQFPENVEVPAF